MEVPPTCVRSGPGMDDGSRVARGSAYAIWLIVIVEFKVDGGVHGLRRRPRLNSVISLRLAET